MTRLCILGSLAAVLAAGSALSAVPGDAPKESRPVAKGTALAFDGPSGLSSGMPPAWKRSCFLGERVTINGTIEDVARQPEGWSAGATSRADVCRGLIDPSTGFAALFGDGRPPPNCEHGSRFWASGLIRTGFEPEFFLTVQTIKCE